jgi:RHS repeat-associated protein
MNIGPVGKYRYGYQGDFAEDDTDETGFNHFELREYDPVIGRWMNVDPARQFASGYIGMGNNPLNNVDIAGDSAKFFNKVGELLYSTIGEEPMTIHIVEDTEAFNKAIENVNSELDVFYNDLPFGGSFSDISEMVFYNPFEEKMQINHNTFEKALISNFSAHSSLVYFMKKMNISEESWLNDKYKQYYEPKNWWNFTKANKVFWNLVEERMKVEEQKNVRNQLNATSSKVDGH